MATSKEKRKHARVRPRGVVAHVRGPSAAFACPVENLSAGGLFLRTEQQLPRGTELHIALVKPGGRKPLHLAGLVAGVITPEEAASARFIPGLGVQFTEIDADEANRLEELLTALGIDRVQAVVGPELRRTNPGASEAEQFPWASPAPSNAGGRAARSQGRQGDPETILRDISEALEAEDAPLATSKPALPPQPAAPPPPNAEPQPSDAARLMTQVRGLLFQLADAQARLRQREAEILDLRAQLDDARSQIEELEQAAAPRRPN
ncbi:MAG TPA: PilZ domain-containing protein [Myxococcales bacterium]|nr:PilZ domain-containing protein [Myxococcales bacterium]